MLFWDQCERGSRVKIHENRSLLILVFHKPRTQSAIERKRKPASRRTQEIRFSVCICFNTLLYPNFMYLSVIFVCHVRGKFAVYLRNFHLLKGRPFEEEYSNFLMMRYFREGQLKEFELKLTSCKEEITKMETERTDLFAKVQSQKWSLYEAKVIFLLTQYDIAIPNLLMLIITCRLKQGKAPRLLYNS